MVDGMLSVRHGKTVWSLKSMVKRIATLGESRLVLMAVDGGEDADYAFEWYATHFHKAENRLLLVHCPETFANVTMMSPGKVQELIKECELKIKSIQDKYLDKMKALGIQGEFVRLDGDKPGHSIIECATSRNVTFIVTGTRGLSKIRRTIMGSVSDYIIHHSPVPVLVCRHKEDPKDGDKKH
ncbi:universal stress protein YxiE [Aplysia californica]|uniref:Universal stress protein YxiE n=1 Tax=Aplysia californica TaxID=6500 RepID=A0ABM0JCZ7_APLCA|nr:universal stress protein YxiE [Aplysia californica]XP_035828227.1 universal stress protein YxiE [Aplysia californica]